MFLNFVGLDLVKVVRRTKGEENIEKMSFGHLNPGDLLQFLLNSVPKILFNIILPRDVLPPQLRS